MARAPKKEVDLLSGPDALFLPDDLCKLFRNKHVVVIGDSIQRCVYKDLVMCLQSTELVSDHELSKKIYDPPFMGDRLAYRTPKTSGPSFCEAREYHSQDGYFLVQYYFVTRCYKNDMEIILQEFEREPPDIIMMNSALWDSTRYEEDMSGYRDRMQVLLTRLRKILPKRSMFIWTTALPTSSDIVKPGFLREETQRAGLTGASLQVNFMIAQLVFAHGFDVLDLHFYVRPFIELYRKKDGVHYKPPLHRHITHLIMGFLYDSFGVPLPDRTKKLLKKHNAGDFSSSRLLSDESIQITPWQATYEKRTKSIAQTILASECEMPQSEGQRNTPPKPKYRNYNKFRGNKRRKSDLQKFSTMNAVRNSFTQQRSPSMHDEQPHIPFANYSGSSGSHTTEQLQRIPTIENLSNVHFRY